MKANLCADEATINPGNIPARTILFVDYYGDKVRPKPVNVPAAALEEGLQAGTELVIVPVERLRTCARLAAELKARPDENPLLRADSLERIAGVIDASIRHASVGEYAGTFPTAREEDRRALLIARLADLRSEAVSQGLPALGSCLLSLVGAVAGRFEESAAKALILEVTRQERTKVK